MKYNAMMGVNLTVNLQPAGSGTTYIEFSMLAISWWKKSPWETDHDSVHVLATKARLVIIVIWKFEETNIIYDMSLFLEVNGIDYYFFVSEYVKIISKIGTVPSSYPSGSSPFRSFVCPPWPESRRWVRLFLNRDDDRNYIQWKKRESCGLALRTSHLIASRMFCLVGCRRGFFESSVRITISPSLKPCCSVMYSISLTSISSGKNEAY